MGIRSVPLDVTGRTYQSAAEFPGSSDRLASKLLSGGPVSLGQRYIGSGVCNAANPTGVARFCSSKRFPTSSVSDRAFCSRNGKINAPQLQRLRSEEVLFCG